MTQTSTAIMPISIKILKITILLAFISLLNTAATPTNDPSPSWFREKLLNEIYDRYYVYLIETDNKDRNSCPEIDKPAGMDALTGTSFLHKHRVRAKMLPRMKYWKTRTPQPTLTINDMVSYLTRIIHFLLQIIITILFLMLTVAVSIMMLILVFGQY
jgi:hypothetical protein